MTPHLGSFFVLNCRKNGSEITQATIADERAADAVSGLCDEKKDVDVGEDRDKDREHEDLRAADRDKCTKACVLGMIKEREKKFGAVQRMNWNHIKKKKKKVEKDEEKQKD